MKTQFLITIKMISILKENEVVQFGDYQEYYEDSNEVYVYKREYDGKKLFVLSNFTAKEVTYDKTLFEAEAKMLLGNYNDLIRGCTSCLKLVLGMILNDQEVRKCLKNILRLVAL